LEKQILYEDMIIYSYKIAFLNQNLIVMKNKLIQPIILLTILSLLGLNNLTATDGYFSVGNGILSKGVAGVGVGYHPYSLIGGNPAGQVFIGAQFDVGVGFFSPIREYTITGAPSGMPGTFGLPPGTVESDSKLFVLPSLGLNFSLGANTTWGISIYGNGGMNTNYPTQTFGDASINTTGVNMAQLFANLNFSQKLNPNHALGLSVVLGYQYFEAEGLSNFAPFSMDAAKLTNNGTDNSLGIGFKVGYYGQLTPQLSLGATYQSRIYMSEFEDYAGLFAEAGDFDIPANWAIGLAYKLTDNWTVLFDVKQILYSTVNAVGNPIDPMALPPAFLNPGGDPNNPADYTPNPNYTPLGSENGSGFGWEDMTILKFGVEYAINTDWTLRAGYSRGNNPVPETEVLFNILAPGVIENHVALGFSTKLGAGSMLNFYVNYAFNNKVSGFNPFDFDPVEAQQGSFIPNQVIDIQMKQFDVGVGIIF
jgi:long-chain fatty acid transport protein